MLTPIEWWGGLIFVLGAAAYKLVMGALEKSDKGISWYRGLMHAFFVLPAVVLAASFYPLHAPWLQYGYLGVLGASLLIVAVMLVQEIRGDDEGQGESGEDTGGLTTVVGALVLYSPALAACGLACAKAWPLAQRLL
jgi:hypothetical protein